MIRSLTESVEGLVFETIGRGFSRTQEYKPLPVDLLENDEVFLLVFDAPGTSSRDIQVEYDEGTVSVRIDRFREYHDDYEMQVPGRGLILRGKASLPADAAVVPDEARATLTADGTVQIEIPKAAPAE